MKSFLLCDDYETLISLSLSGIDGKEVHSKEEILEQLERLLSDKEYALIIISENVLEMAREEIMDIKLRVKDTLIIQIPGPDGFKDKNYIKKYIRESIGIKV